MSCREHSVILQDFICRETHALAGASRYICRVFAWHFETTGNNAYQFSSRTFQPAGSVAVDEDQRVSCSHSYVMAYV